MPSIIKRLFWLLALLALATIAETASAQSGFAPVYRGGICVADGTGACIGGDIRAESGLGPQVGYMKTSSDAGTVAVYRSTCYSDTAGNCTAWGLSLDVNGTPVGYLSTTAPDTQSANSPLVQSNGLLLQNLGGTPSAFVWTTIPPNISSLSPTSGPVGTPVTISGTNFGATQGTSTATFNGVTAAPSSWSDTSIVAPVPAGATTGPVVVTVAGSPSNGVTFTVTTVFPDLVVSSLSNPPASAVAGGSFDVTDTTANTGTGSAGASTTRYRLSLDSTITGTDPLLTGTRSVPSLAAGANSTGTVSVAIPGGLSPGSYFLGACADDLGVVSESNETNNCRASATTVVVSAPPNITTLSPNSGPVGTAVTVTGTNFGATQGTSTVTFNGVTATPTSWSSTSLVTPVPAGATTGPVVVSVGGVASNGVTFTVTTKLAVTSINGGANPTAGAPFSVVVQSQDAGGAPANVSAATSVTLSLKTGTGILGGTLTGTIAAGTNQVTISGVTYSKAESGVVLTATRTSGDALSAGDSAPFTVDPGAATKLVFTVQPANAAAGTSIPGPPTVVVQDSQGNTVTSSTASITLAIGTNPGGGTLSGTTTKSAVSGSASFTDLSINKSGSGYTLMASASGLTSATSSAFNITAAAATKLAFTVQPGNATAGATIPGPPTVTVRDAFDNTVTTSTASITLAIGTNPGGGTLSGTTTKNAVSGVASFTDLSINQAGNGYTLTASSTGLTGATSGTFNITQPPANITLVKTVGTATPSTTGTTTSITVPAGGVAAGNSVIVAFALDPATGAVSCNDTPGNSYAVDTDITNGSGTSGVRTVVLSAHNVLALAGGNSITCTHPSVGKRALGANEFSGISPTNPRDQTAAATGNSTTPSSGSTAATTQAAEMLFGAIGVEGPAGDTFTAGTGYTTIGRAGTTGAAAASNITVNPEYQVVGTVGTFAATGTLSTARPWAAAIVTYKAATGAPPPTKLAVLSVNGGSNPSAGVGFPVVVQAQDSSGTPANVISATGVTLSLKTGTGTLGGTLTGTIAAGTNQVTINGVTYSKAESGVVITATRTSGDALSAGDSAPFTVNPGAATKLAFTVQPANAAAGTSIPGPPTVAVQDSLGNTVTSSTASITVAIGTNPGGGTLSGTTTKNAVSGVAGFTDLSINKSGSGYTLTASATGLTGATSSVFNITAAAATKLAFTVQPGNATAGATIPGPPTVTVRDAFDNTVTTSTASITLAIGTNPGGGTLSGTTTKNAVSGVASFTDLSINQVGVGYTLTASSTGLTGATSASFNVSAGVATKLVITSVNGGSNPTAGTAFPVVVQSQDAGGGPANVSAATGVTLSLKTGTGTLGGTLTGTIAAGTNQVTISGVTYSKAESGVVLTATRTSGDALSAGDSAPFTVNPGAATKLAFTVQPGNAAAGSPISGPPTVAVQDSLGNTVTSSTASITVAIGTNPGGGTLTGTTTKNAVSGVASFTDLSINQAANGYTLAASSTGLTGATSNAFNITAATGTLAGTVMRASDGGAIAGALVEALQAGAVLASTTTGSTGSYSIGGLVAGTYDVRASTGGFATQTRTGIAVNSGATTTVNFSLAASGALPPPLLLRPSLVAKGVSTLPTFSWSLVPGSTGYSIMVASAQSALPTSPNAKNCPKCIISAQTSGQLATSYTSTVTLATNTTYYWQVIAQGAGNQSGTWSAQWRFTTRVSSAPIIITSHTGGAVIDEFEALVFGEINAPEGMEVGVTVNGQVALVDMGQFVAVVLVDQGVTELTAVSRDVFGNVLGSYSIPVTVQLPTTESPLFFRPSPVVGPPPLTVGFTLTSLNEIALIELDANGDGTVDFTGGTLEGQAVTFAGPGIYFPTVRVTHADNTVNTDVAIVQVLDLNQLDALLRSKWNSMKDALRSGNTAEAATYIINSKREDYQTVFNNLTIPFAGIDQMLGNITYQAVKGLDIEYEMLMDDGPDGEVSYMVLFSLDEDGVWRISFF